MVVTSFGLYVTTFQPHQRNLPPKYATWKHSFTRGCYIMSSSSNLHLHRNNEESIIQENSISSLVYPIPALERMNQWNSDDGKVIWSDRMALQHTMTCPEKGWQVSVEWKTSPAGYGIGVFAQQFISARTILRIGRRYDNLIPLNSIQDIESFCHAGGPTQYTARLQYVQDYLWGYYPSSMTDENGYPCSSSNDNENKNEDERFFGMWIPGNGLNHNNIPNTVYRNDADDFVPTTPNGQQSVLYLVALSDIEKGDELYDDYRRHGTTPPLWLKNYATEKNITLNFADCNDFVLG